ncbi:hypothetical protein HAHE_13220 [Haloferula helveola]|uniref:DUF4126 domain-containing protein n=1 Tax=Haloferula helveola TaxID=490095 RepID=A0ABM7RIG4_9BACT|nr:hypothetical protein HAHE_13220 [Haloferula helveola]
MSEAIAILAGIGLAAACGFRVFLPLFIASLAVQTGVDGVGGFELRSLLGDSLPWLGTMPVTIAFGVATVLEVGAYYIPWLDNALDTVSTPAAMIAGTLVAFAFFPGIMDDGYLKWAIAAIAGGGTAGVVQGGSVAARGTSSATTGGFGNVVVATTELIGSVVTSILAVFLPLIAGLLAIALCAIVITAFVRIRRRIRAKA